MTQLHQPAWRAYLHFGYDPRHRVLPFELPATPLALPSDPSSAAAYAGDVLSRCVQESLTSGGKHYIPLSGGLDSRALLAATMELGANVHTLTFGTPGTFDYDYGNKIAKIMGCPHENFNLLNYLPDTAALVDTVRNGGHWTYTFDAYFNRLLTAQLGSNDIVLHGYIGDLIGGSYAKAEYEPSSLIRKKFSRSQKFTQHTTLLPKSVDPVDWVPELEDLPTTEMLTFYELLGSCVRVPGLTRPIVIDPKSNVKTPFLHRDWVGLMFSAPLAWRKRCKFYHATLAKRWPDFFNLPTKNYLGRGLGDSMISREFHTRSRRFSGRLSRFLGRKSWVQRRNYNYIDFASAFREHRIMYTLARENLSDLEERDLVPWLKPIQFLEDHMSGRKDYERELQLLIGLEINLKAENSP